MGMATAHATGLGMEDGHAPSASSTQHPAEQFRIYALPAIGRVCLIGREERTEYLESPVRIKRCSNVPCSGPSMELRSPCCPYGT